MWTCFNSLQTFDKKYLNGTVTCADKLAIESKIMSNQCPSDLVRVAKISDSTRELAEELHMPIIRKLESLIIF